MQKIGNIPNTRADNNGEFTDGNVAGGVPPTILPAEWFNTIQRELISILSAAGITPDSNKFDQVSKAVSKLITDGGFLKTVNNLSEIKDAGTAAQAAALKNLGSSDGTLNGRLLNIQVFNAAGQYTPTPGMKFILAHMIGGGGASGGTPATSSTQTGGSAAGNGGAYAFIKAYANDIGAGKAINIGAGGTTQVNSSGFAGGITSIADIAEVTGGYGSNPGSVSATTAVAQPSYGKPVVNKYNKTEILISSLGSQASNFLQSATGSGTGWISQLSTFPGGEKGRGGSGVFVNASTAAQPGLPGNSGAILIMEYA